MNKKEIPIIIPAYQPDERLEPLLEQLTKENLKNIILVDDGSGEKYERIFKTAKEKYDCIVLRHAVNQGKGRALKTAFNYCLNTYPDLIGCVTADSDGQHSVQCIKKCMNALTENPDSLIMGCRNFDAEGVPDKSRLGNKISRWVCSTFCGVKVSDTQTGLRAIPKAFMAELLNVSGERFEFETNMLIVSKDKIQIKEVEIETIYDSKENHTTHFNPIKDSFRIYKLFLKSFVKFLVSSLSSSCIDILLFSVFCNLLRKGASEYYVVLATIFARIISATYNYCINYKLVFSSKTSVKGSALRYAALAIVQGTLSSVCVAGFVSMLHMGNHELFVKIPVDVVLFVISFVIQREFVYRTKRKDEQR